MKSQTALFSCKNVTFPSKINQMPSYVCNTNNGNNNVDDDTDMTTVQLTLSAKLFCIDVNNHVRLTLKTR